MLIKAYSYNKKWKEDEQQGLQSAEDEASLVKFKP